MFFIKSHGLRSFRCDPKASIAVFGSQGRTGKCVVNQALKINKNVVSFARSIHDIESTDSNTIVKGDVTSLEDVQKVYKDHAISGTIICLGGDTSKVGVSMLTEGTKNIIECIKDFSASKKIAVVTSIGAGYTVNDPPFFFQILMSTFLKDAFVDKNNQEALFLDTNGIGSDLDYTIIRPSGLTQGNLKSTMIIDNGSGTIPRKNVADFCLNVICDETFPYKKKTVSITASEKDREGVVFQSKI